MNKLYIFGLVALFFIAIPMGQCFDGADLTNLTDTLSYTSSNNIITTYYLPQNISLEHVEVRTMAELKSYTMYISPVSNSPPLNNTTFYYNCLGSSENLTLSERIGWNDNGFAIILVNLLPGYEDQIINSKNNEEDYILNSNTCTFAIYGQEVYLSILTLPKFSQADLSGFFTTPDDAMGQLVTRTTDTLTSSFDIIKMLLVITGFILTMFLLVFVWKLLEYFVSRVKGGLNN
jgi:hypothetical protein